MVWLTKSKFLSLKLKPDHTIPGQKGMVHGGSGHSIGCHNKHANQDGQHDNAGHLKDYFFTRIR